MGVARDPADVLRNLMQGISDRRWDALAELYAENALVEHPFALPSPTRILGRSALRTHFLNFAAVPLSLRVSQMIVHGTADPEVVVAEWDYEGVVTTTGQSFRVANVQVSRVRSGLIITSRDYHNHAFMAAVTGRMSVLISALSEVAPEP